LDGVSFRCRLEGVDAILSPLAGKSYELSKRKSVRKGNEFGSDSGVFFRFRLVGSVTDEHKEERRSVVKSVRAGEKKVIQDLGPKSVEKKEKKAVRVRSGKLSGKMNSVCRMRETSRLASKPQGEVDWVLGEAQQAFSHLGVEKEEREAGWLENGDSRVSWEEGVRTFTLVCFFRFSAGPHTLLTGERS
jgi:hypothetical protein